MICSICHRKMQKAIRGEHVYYVCLTCDCIRVVEETTK